MSVFAVCNRGYCECVMWNIFVDVCCLDVADVMICVVVVLCDVLLVMLYICEVNM